MWQKRPKRVSATIVDARPHFAERSSAPCGPSAAVSVLNPLIRSLFASHYLRHSPHRSAQILPFL